MIKVYRAVITLLYIWETWVIYCCHIKTLEQFHQYCLQYILGLSWEEKMNMVVLEMANMYSIKTLMYQRLGWTGHLV